MTKTFWLSFCDNDRPEGEQFLGAVVIDVTEDDCALALPRLLSLRASHDLPPPEDAEAYWLAAAIAKSHASGCNPGGEVASIRLDLHPRFVELSDRYPRERLLSRDEIEALEP